MSRKSVNWVFALLMLPTVAIVVGLLIFPLFWAGYMSLGEIEVGTLKYSFVGLENYWTLLGDVTLWTKVIGNTFYFAIAAMVPSTLIGLVLALLANEDFRGVKIYRTLLLIPYAVSPVASGIIWKWLYHAQFGLLNYVLKELGIISTYKTWLGDPSTAMQMVIIAEVWKSIPFLAILLLARLQTVPSDIYEAAKVDGANKVQRFFHVTIPAIKSTLVILLLIEAMWSFRSFTTIYTLTRGGPGNATSVMSYYAYEVGFHFFKFGYASALAILNAVLIMVICLAYIKVLSRE